MKSSCGLQVHFLLIYYFFSSTPDVVHVWFRFVETGNHVKHIAGVKNFSFKVFLFFFFSTNSQNFLLAAWSNTKLTGCVCILNTVVHGIWALKSVIMLERHFILKLRAAIFFYKSYKSHHVWWCWRLLTLNERKKKQFLGFEVHGMC